MKNLNLSEGIILVSSVLTPIIPAVVFVALLVGFDTYLAIRVSIKNKGYKGVNFKKLIVSIDKVLMYSILLSMVITGEYIIKLYNIHLMKSIPAFSIILAIVIYIEFKSIARHIIELRGLSIKDMLLQYINFRKFLNSNNITNEQNKKDNKQL